MRAPGSSCSGGRRRDGRDRPRGRPGAPTAHRSEPLLAPDPGVLPLPILAREPAAGVRPNGGAGVPPRHPGRHVRRVGAGPDPGRDPRRLRRPRGRALMELSREEYARRYGPTTGDLVRLGDTDLRVRVEADDVGYGDEPMWGVAKNWRSRQAQQDRAA